MERPACHGGTKDWRRRSGGALCAGGGARHLAAGRRRRELREGRARGRKAVVALSALDVAQASAAAADMASSVDLAALPTALDLGFVSTVAALAGSIICHEAGHYFCARSVGLPTLEFAIGFGPEIVTLGNDGRGTDFVLRALPAGGYVRFDDRKTKVLESGEAVNDFDALPALQRVWVLSGGVLANMVVAWSSLCATALTSGVQRIEPRAGVRVDEVGAEAFARTGLMKDDIIQSIGSLDCSGPGQSMKVVVDFIRHLPKDPVKVLVERGGQQLRLDVSCLTDADTGLQRLGVLIRANQEKLLEQASDFAGAASIASGAVVRMLGEQFSTIQSLVSGTGSGEVVGPVGIVQQGQELAGTDGLAGLAFFFITVNLNLALLNALPIPALDGGKVAFVFIEQLLGKRLPEEKKQDVELLFGLLVIASLLNLTVKDVSKIFTK